MDDKQYNLKTVKIYFVVLIVFFILAAIIGQISIRQGIEIKSQFRIQQKYLYLVNHIKILADMIYKIDRIFPVVISLIPFVLSVKNFRLLAHKNTTPLAYPLWFYKEKIEKIIAIKIYFIRSIFFVSIKLSVINL